MQEEPENKLTLDEEIRLFDLGLSPTLLSKEQIAKLKEMGLGKLVESLDDTKDADNSSNKTS